MSATAPLLTKAQLRSTESYPRQQHPKAGGSGIRSSARFAVATEQAGQPQC